ncbi:MAG: hypothetical protein COA93_03835 [Alphaproteobacteria bacterium]|nr:MAG: hypothetical protein COA93_03835 [Alphaproteobacteria bacterium]
MRIAIMGSGGMGGYLGAKLAVSGHDVIFIARGRHLDALKSNGLKLISQNGDIHINKPSVYEDTRDVGPVDLILFCVKLYDTKPAALACKPMMNHDTFLLTLQNGVESADIISSIIGPGKTISGAIYVSASIQSPGIIKHSGGNDTIRFAEADNLPSARTDILENIFDQAGLIGLRADNMKEMLWSKFVLLCANAGLGSLTDSGTKTMCSDPDTKEILLAAMWEVFNVAKAMDIMLPESIIEDILNLLLHDQQEEMIASQCLDLRCGKMLELEWIQGTLHRLGKLHNVPTPINSTAYVALRRFASGSKSN